MAQPLYYSEEPGAPWKPWTLGNLDGRGLKKRDPVAVTINGISVHALHFGPADEWDCLNGKREFSIPAPQPVPAVPEPTQAPAPAPIRLDPQEFAMRVWRNQSPDTLGRSERVRRVRAALEAQGLSMDGVTLPN